MSKALTWAIVALGLHPEHIATLRAEITTVFASNSKNPYDQLRFMECFLRESSRLNSIDACTHPRTLTMQYQR
jgi:cytochrome P450